MKSLAAIITAAALLITIAGHNDKKHADAIMKARFGHTFHK